VAKYKADLLLFELTIIVPLLTLPFNFKLDFNEIYCRALQGVVKKIQMLRDFSPIRTPQLSGTFDAFYLLAFAPNNFI